MNDRFLPLQGLRVLVVEDDFLIAAEIEHILEELQCTVVGPAASVAAALIACRDETFDGATLDMNLRGQSVLPVAQLLLEMEAPFLFVTGYPSHGRDVAALGTARRVSKPFSLDSLGDAMLEVFASRMAGGMGPCREALA